jgi:hypothetical protein
MRTIKQILLAVALMMFLGNTHAQENSERDKPLRIGIGVRGNTFSQNEMNMRVMPPAKMYLNFDIMKYVRLDLQIGFSKKKTDAVFPNNYKMTLTDKTYVFAFGLFGMYKVDKVNFYGGLRFGRIGYSWDDTFYYPNANTPTRYLNEGKVGTMHFTFGGEYFLHSKVSIGAEIGLGIFHDTFTPGNPGQAIAPAVQKSKTTGTDIALLFRFYPL